ncbi:hypothetical protein QTP88_003347 [Uroleucon formosanum]
MQDINTNKWSERLRFVQFMKTKAYHSGIKRSPYNAMFGTNPKTGLTSSILPHTILQDILSNENRKRKQTEKRQNARDNLEIQAKKMKNLSNAKFPEAKEGSTVQLKIPDIDRGRGDTRSIISVVSKLLKMGSINLDVKVVHRAFISDSFLRLVFQYEPDIEYYAPSKVVIDAMDKECGHCHGLKFENEPAGMCCASGKVQLPEIENRLNY